MSCTYHCIFDSDVYDSLMKLISSFQVPMTSAMMSKIQDLCIQYGTGRDTLRCLALGTIDSPMSPSQVQYRGYGSTKKGTVIWLR